MARNYRMRRQDYFTASSGSKVLTAGEKELRKQRQELRTLKSSGLIGPKLPSIWIAENGEEILAHTKSEARAILKLQLGLKRLPIGYKLERVEYSI
jgi:hypothetical protein